MTTFASTLSTAPEWLTLRPTPPREAIHVAVAVLRGPGGTVLVTRRPKHVHHAGSWEFPGGKVEPGEDVTRALRRELDEELGVELLAARPLITVHHEYPDRQVWLDVWCAEAWRGTPVGREGQPLSWVPPDDLLSLDLLPADVPIISAVRLPSLYLITPEPTNSTEFVKRLRQCMHAGATFVQLRVKSLPPGLYEDLAKEVIDIAHDCDCRVLLNTEPEQAIALGADGVHLNSERLHMHGERPLPKPLWVAVSCHTRRDFEQARKVKADFAVLGPVQSTPAHAGAAILGWQRFAEHAQRACMSVYALGGMQPADVATAWYAGGQGIACIRGVWAASDCEAAIACALEAKSGT